MTEEMMELGRRAVACKGWRWLPGMRMLHPSMGPARVLRVTGQGVWVAKEESLASGFRVEEDGCVPDLTDPATLGCLLALVREAWRCHVHLRRWASPAPDMSGRDRSTWEPVDGLGRRLVAGPRVLCETEAEALVAALEAAP